MQINPGVLNKKIQIICYILTKDLDGFEVKTEEVLLKTWAQVSNKSGKEIYDADSDFSVVQTRFLVRTPKLVIDKDYKIKFRGKIYEIIYINDYSFDGIYTEILTNEVEK
ncbi:MAG: phage head closure protein [Oscillospiraceae bacterium]|jgi:SPP1 family predicted phage head-tail adaptor|nr:phage head closure protein [Oscillospiraceae bacterium]